MKRVYVVTHPEAEHHVDGLVGGWFDSGLTNRGRLQAGLISQRIADLVAKDVSVELYSSDLRRAVQTADAIAERLGVEPVLLRQLREKSYGIAEGKAQTWLEERFVPPPKNGDRLNHDEGIEAAETKRDFARRVYDGVDDVLTSGCNQQIVVTHGFALTLVIAAWIKLPIEAAGHVHFVSSSGGITILEQDDFFNNRSVVILNDTAHLAGS